MDTTEQMQSFIIWAKVTDSVTKKEMHSVLAVLVVNGYTTFGTQTGTDGMLMLRGIPGYDYDIELRQADYHSVKIGPFTPPAHGAAYHRLEMTPKE